MAPNLKYLSPLLTGWIVFFIALTLILSFAIPLGESSDERAFFDYIDFIYQQDRLPTSAADMLAAGYKSNWPPLYYFLAQPGLSLGDVVFGPAMMTGPPRELKSTGSQRYIIATDGFTGQTILHTDDEAFPFRGLVLRWHLARGLSPLLGGVVLLTLFSLLRQDFSFGTSLGTVIVVSLIPQITLIYAVLSDDTLLALMMILYLLTLWPLFERPGTGQRYLLIGLITGLTFVTKYTVLLLPLGFLGMHFILSLILRRRLYLSQVLLYGFGGLIGSGWWLAYQLINFNQIDRLGWLWGSLMPLFNMGGLEPIANSVAPETGLNISGGGITNFPDLRAWLAWVRVTFSSLWFGRSASIVWLWPLILLVLIGGGGVFYGLIHRPDTAEKPAPNRVRSSQPVLRAKALVMLLHVVLFLPAPIIRYIFTGSLAETGQGRHILIPALGALAWLTIYGLQSLPWRRSLILGLGGATTIFILSWPSWLWPAVTWADTPPLPVQTISPPVPDQKLNLAFGEAIRLVGLDFLPPESQTPNTWGFTLIWESLALAESDYQLQLSLMDEAGDLLGGWQGQMLNGRYPTRAWVPGDFVRHTIRFPLLSPVKAGTPYSLTVTLFPNQSETTLLGQTVLTVHPQAGPIENRTLALLPRSDRLAAGQPYRYRNTIAFLRDTPSGGALPSWALVGPGGERVLPVEVLNKERRSIALFQVNWSWPGGRYRAAISSKDVPKNMPEIWVETNSRRREIPPISHLLEANFAGKILLLGYDMPARRFEQGVDIPITLYWQALQIVSTDYIIFNHLLDSRQIQRGGQDRRAQTYYSTLLWQPGEVVVDHYTIPIIANAPSGVYWLYVGLYPQGEVAEALPRYENGTPLAENHVRLGPFKIGGPPSEARPTNQPAQRRQVKFGAAIEWQGYSLQVERGQGVNLTTVWQALGPPSEDYTLFVHVVDSSGQVIAQGDGPPVNGLYPTFLWEVGEQIQDQRQILLLDLSPNTYTLRLGWYNPITGQRLPVANNSDDAVMVESFSWPPLGD